VRAARVHEFGPPSILVVDEVDDLTPGPGEVLVAVAAVSVNFPDLLVVSGEYQNLPERPFSPGKEAAGRIAAVGEGVTNFSVGDRVLTLMEYGGYAEQLVVPAELAFPLPDAVTFENAAAAGLVFSTAYFAFHRRVQINAGDTVLITGAAGGVGSAGIQLAKLAGARVLALVHSAEKAEFVRSLGADVVLTSGPETLRDDVRAATDGHGVDIVLDMLGGDYLSQAVRATAWEGSIIIVGFAAGGQNPIKPGHLLVKNISIHGLQGSDYRDRTPDLMAEAMREVFANMATGELVIPIDRTYDLTDIAAALTHVADRRVMGKVVITTGAAS
jgi:NADPH2:quinone reductase